MNDPIGAQLETKQWVEILKNKELTYEIDLNTIIEFSNGEDYTSAGSKVAPKVGLKNVGTINLNFFRYAQRISNNYNVQFLQYKNRESYWRLFFNGYRNSGFYFWKTRPELIEALIHLNLIVKQNVESNYKLDEEDIYTEGAKSIVETIHYERSEKARSKCIQIYGCKCFVCKFDFESKFGELGSGYIHVHHKKSIASSGKEHEINPKIDLVPLCPNCHAMIHRKRPMLSIDELKEIIKENE